MILVRVRSMEMQFKKIVWFAEVLTVSEPYILYFLKLRVESGIKVDLAPAPMNTAGSNTISHRVTRSANLLLKPMNTLETTHRIR